jgi:hypothetical protein
VGHDPTQRRPGQCADDDAHDQTAAELDDTEHDPLERPHVAAPGFDQPHGEQDRHRVVAARFHLQQVPEPGRQPAVAERREHRSGIGGRDDRPQQPCRRGVETEQPDAAERHHRSRDHHPDRGQQPPGDQHPAHRGGSRGQAAFEQDDGERDHRDRLRQRDVVEAHQGEAVVGDHHAQAEEREQAGHPQPAGDQPGHDA